MSDDPKLEMILHRERGGNFELYACRGKGKGCKRNSFREKKKPCADCFGPCPPTWTVGQVLDHIKKGDA